MESLRTSEAGRADSLATDGGQVLAAADGKPSGQGERLRASRRRSRMIWFAGYGALITLLFAKPLLSLMEHAAATELHSHILLIPFISLWLLWTNRRGLPGEFRSSWTGAGLFLLAGLATLPMTVGTMRGALSWNDFIAVATASYLCLLVAGGFIFLGGAWMKAAAFPVFFLVFMVPLPDQLVALLEDASTFASAEAANLFFSIARVPVFREGPVFHLPGIVIEVARECSGIRSSWVLFITSLLASYLFLMSPWRRAGLVAFSIPLGIARNGFRILVIGWLCVHEGHHMIHSQIHRQGGPVFFVLSLIPLVAAIWLLRRKDRPLRKATTSARPGFIPGSGD